MREGYFGLEITDKGKCLYNILNIEDNIAGDVFNPGVIFYRKNLNGSSDILDGLEYDTTYLSRIIDTLSEDKQYPENILFEIN